MTTQSPSAPSSLHGQRPPGDAPPPAPGVPTRYLSGIQPSGELHLGNYFGAISQYLALQETAGGADHAFYFIANYHSLTTVHDAAQLRELTRGVALDYLALGLDPAKATLFRQSDVPEVCELAWMLSCTVGKGLLERATSYKDKVAKGIEPSMGLFNYPVLMAADILIYRGTIVPVGKDQQQHVELAQDMAEAFNRAFKTEVLVRPTWRFNPAAAVVPGIDGEKMSKSYKNTIPIFPPASMTPKQIWKTFFAQIKTDSRDAAAPKDPHDTLMTLYRLVDPQGAAAYEPTYVAGGEESAYGVLKKRLEAAYMERFGALAHRRAELAADPDYVEDVLATGARRARAVAREVMAHARAASGLATAAETHR